MRPFPWLVLAGVLLTGGQVRACSIPVFRYALERWTPAGYQMHVFHRGALTARQKAVVARFEKPATPVNLDVHVVDLAGKPAPEALALWRQQPGDTPLPFVVVRHTEAEEDEAPLYQG